jgi:hypothetical protein
MEWISRFAEDIRQREQSSGAASACHGDGSSLAVPAPAPATVPVSMPASLTRGCHDHLADADAKRKALYCEIESDEAGITL